MKTAVDVLYYLTAFAAALLWFKSASTRLTKIGAGLEDLDHVHRLSSDLQRSAYWNCCAAGVTGFSVLLQLWGSNL